MERRLDKCSAQVRLYTVVLLPRNCESRKVPKTQIGSGGGQDQFRNTTKVRALPNAWGRMRQSGTSSGKMERQSDKREGELKSRGLTEFVRMFRVARRRQIQQRPQAQQLSPTPSRQQAARCEPSSRICAPTAKCLARNGRSGVMAAAFEVPHDVCYGGECASDGEWEVPTRSCSPAPP